MAPTSLSVLIARYRVVSRIRELGGRGDAELLGLFARERDEAAFELLLRRYGPMVMGVCSRILQHRQDAEDAFQATFLLLAQRAGRLRSPGDVGSWLYGVARRTALEARTMAARRKAKERQAPARCDPVPDPVRDEALVALDEELARLPEVYRAALVLCDLAGKSRTEAAAALGCAAGTVASRLARGRALLARRLARRGIALTAGALAGSLGSGAAASVGPQLVQATARMAALLAAAPRAAVAVAPPAVFTLMKGASHMFLSKGVHLVLAAVVASALGVGAVAVSRSAADPRAAGVPSSRGPDEAGRSPRRARQEPPAAASEGRAPGRKSETPAERLARLQAAYQAEEKAATEEVKDPKSGQVTERRTKQIPPDKYLPQLLELGRVNDEATAAAALSMAVFSWPNAKAADEAFDLLLKRFAGSPRLADFARESFRHGYPGKDKHLKRLAAEAKDPTALGLALLQLAQEADPNFHRILGETPAQEDARRDKALALYRRVVSEFPTVEGGAPAALARRCITRLQQLRTGLAAPPIAGTDLDGKRMALADFKGRVVVIDFWGSWCGPCRRKLPMMKEVQGRYAKKGVVFLGVMAEATREDAAKAVAAEKVPWRNWLDLRDAQTGESPIVKAWGVVGFPSVYVLDGEGKIRFTGVTEQNELERALDQLLGERPPKD